MRVAVSLGLSGLTFALLVELYLGVAVGRLFFGTALFTALLAIPLFLLSVLHPEVRITTDGLRLRPLIGRMESVSWSSVKSLTDHPLIYEDPVIHRRLYGKHRPLREGKAVILNANTSISWRYRLLGTVSGEGWTPAFGISSTTHTDYDQLLATLIDHINDSQ